MNHDVSFLHELWDSAKHFIPKKDKLQAAEVLVRVFDDHEAGIRDIDPYLNHCCCNQQVQLFGLKLAHDIGFGAGCHASVHKPNPHIRQ